MGPGSDETETELLGHSGQLSYLAQPDISHDTLKEPFSIEVRHHTAGCFSSVVTRKPVKFKQIF